jgi:hypothetical protein
MKLVQILGTGCAKCEKLKQEFESVDTICNGNIEPNSQPSSTRSGRDLHAPVSCVFNGTFEGRRT